MSLMTWQALSIRPYTKDPSYVHIPIVIIDDNYKLKLTPAAV